MTYGYKDICEKPFRKINEHTVVRVSSRIPESISMIFQWFFQKHSRFSGYKYRINMNKKSIVKHHINHRMYEKNKFGKNECTTIKCTKPCTWYLKCAQSNVSNRWKNSMIFQGWFFYISWFFQFFGAFSKFHDFSRSGKFFFIFQVSMIFPEAGKPD